MCRADGGVRCEGWRRAGGAALAASALLAALLLACCEGGEPAPAPPSQKIGQGITLHYWAPGWLGSRRAEETGAIELYQKLEEVTGIHIEMMLPIATSSSGQLEALRAAGTEPDIIEWSWQRSYPGGATAAMNDGLIASLGRLIPQHAPNLFRLIAEREDIARAISTPDGRYYAFPDLRTDPATRSWAGPLFRKDWLEKVGRQPPETLEQWHEVLRAFKGTSFGSTGSAPEYPFFILTNAPRFEESELTLPYFAESNAFAGAYGVAHGFYRSGGSLKYGPAQPEYRQVLELLASWYAEGLIHPAIAEPAAPRNWIDVIAKCGAWIGGVDAADYLEPLKYVPAPLPRLEAEERTSFLGPTIPQVYLAERAAAVSASSSHKEEAVRWLDVGYAAWGSLLYNFGIEGTSYELKRGEPELMESTRRAVLGETGSGAGVFEALYRFSRGQAGGPFDLSGELYRQYREAAVPGTSAAYMSWQAGAQVDPRSVLDADPGQAAEFERLYAPIRLHRSRGLSAFISGRRSLDEFGEFTRELDELGLRNVLELLGTAEAAWRAKPALVR